MRPKTPGSNWDMFYSLVIYILYVYTASSLKWESFEQYCVWQLFAAHDIPVDVALPLVQKLDPKQHAESLSTLLIALKRKK